MAVTVVAYQWYISDILPTVSVLVVAEVVVVKVVVAWRGDGGDGGGGGLVW